MEPQSMCPAAAANHAPRGAIIASEEDQLNETEAEVTHTSPDDSPPVLLSLRQRCGRLKVVFLLIYLLGAGSAVASPNIPDLIVSTFGGNAYVVSGLFQGGKGLLTCVYASFIGALSDGHTRRHALLATQTVSTFGAIVFLSTSGNFWAFSFVDLFLGVAGPILALLMTCVTDFIPVRCPARTESFAITMFFFLLGVGTGPLAGAFVEPTIAFALAVALGLASVVVTFFWLPPPTRYEQEDLAISREWLRIAQEEGRCPVLPDMLARMQPSSSSSPPTATTGLLSAAANDTSDGGGAKCPYTGAGATTATAVEVESSVLSEEEDDGMNQKAAAHQLLPIHRRWWKNICTAATEMHEVFTECRPLRLVLLIVFWSALCQDSLESSLTLYLKKRVHFTSANFGPFIAVVALSGLISLGLVVPILKRRVGTSITLMISVAANVCFALGLALLFAKWQAYAVCVFGILGYGVFPCSSSLVAHVVPQKRAGAAQGILTSMRYVAQGVGPAVFGAVFHVTEGTSVPGTSYFIGAVCGIIALAVAFVVRRTVHLP